MGDKHIVPEPPFWFRPIFLLLDEVPGALGQTLWQYARHLRDRTSVSESQRSTLVHQRFAPRVLDRISAAKREVPELAEALDRFGMVVLSPNCDDHDLARASETVADWAESCGYLWCATEFAELAALLEPQSASAANRAGRLNRNASIFHGRKFGSNGESAWHVAPLTTLSIRVVTSGWGFCSKPSARIVAPGSTSTRPLLLHARTDGGGWQLRRNTI